MTIFNRFTLSGEGAPSLAGLVGRLVLGVEETSTAARLRLTGGVGLEVDLRDEAYEGPEAMVLHCEDEIVVWN